MSNSLNASLFQSANNSTSTLRPRTARLISFLDDEGVESRREDAGGGTSTSSSTTSLPQFPNHGISPAAATKGPERTKDAAQSRTAGESGGALSASYGLWESWSSIQGIASTLLGSSDVPSSGKGNGKGKGKDKNTFKAPLWMKQDKGYVAAKRPSPLWGPNADGASDSVPGSMEERQAMVQAKKREALLLANNTKNRDGAGRYKRRDSDSRGPEFSTSNEVEEDALVYVHKVQPQDTLAGVMIKYGCQPDVFKKVNRFWPNDNIQTRTHVMVPVDASAIRGKKVDAFDEPQDLLDAGFEDTTTFGANSSPFSEAGGHARPVGPEFSAPSLVSSESLSLTNSESPYRHESWVMLPSFTEPVEIVRVSRRALGYFPRARRKSRGTLTDTSPTSSPKSSFDMLHHPPTHAAQISISLNASPVRRPVVHPRMDSGRSRSSSTTATSNSFAEALRGPGGVGTLRGLRTEASRPGPADDPLNRKFAQYLPDLTPPDNMSRSTLRPTLRATPRASTDSIRSTRSNSSGFADVGGAIEGWVRKIAGTKRDRSTCVGKMGDLIELETNSDPADASGNSINTNDDDKKEGDAGHTPIPKPAGPSTGVNATARTGASHAIATEQALLNERFPIRGRVRNAYSVGKDKGD